jgi:aspartyl-tRNA(Asn)/glutamyl-tRNA(Gln) amidotransferase subunit A
VKDLFDVAGSVTRAGSRVLAGHAPAERDAAAVARLRAAGAVLVGATNMSEFAMGSLGINPHYGTPLNPWDRAAARIPGGSSSGAAVSIADGMALAAVGSDTMGSVRMPAALCGVVGFKPTARRVPLEGVIPLAPSLDSIGVLSSTVAGCALVDAVLAGDAPALPQETSAKGLRFAVPKAVVLEDLDWRVAQAFDAALSALSRAGCSIANIEFNELRELPQVSAKCSFHIAEGYAWHRELLAAHRAQYDPLIAGRLASGALISDAEYRDLVNARNELIPRAREVTRDFDAVLMPTMAFVAVRVADVQGEAAFRKASFLAARNTGVANFLDRCAASLPCHAQGEAPVGLMMMGEAMSDERLLAMAHAVEPVLAPGRVQERQAQRRLIDRQG